jgi:hypothetical protein
MTTRQTNTYDLQYQAVWRERAVDFDHASPLWYRVMCLAYGSHRRNGHATFAPGEIAKKLHASSDSRVSDAIAEAKSRGLIDARSTSRCLIVPPHAIILGPGDANEPCAYCEGKRVGRRAHCPQIRSRASRRPIPQSAPERQPQSQSDTNAVPFSTVPVPA